MKPSDMLIGLIFMALVMTAVVQVGNEGARTLGTTENLQSIDTQYNETSQLSAQIEDTLKSSSVSIPVLGTVPIVSGAWQAVNLMFNLGNYMKNMVGNGLTALGVQPAYQFMVFTMITISITMAIGAVAFKWWL